MEEQAAAIQRDGHTALREDMVRTRVGRPPFGAEQCGICRVPPGHRLYLESKGSE